MFMKDIERKQRIYTRTNGYCHICHRKLSFTNYGVNGAKGAWHIEHSIPKAKGGSDHLNNLFAACIICNHEKGTKHTQTIRRRNGITRAPYSKAKKEKIKEENTLMGMIGGGLLGTVFGPGGVIVCTILGGLFGEDLSPKR
jgi:5-methylcytosine-specific restriction endonuclease McrA